MDNAHNICSSCGAVLEKSAKFCTECGKAVEKRGEVISLNLSEISEKRKKDKMGYPGDPLGKSLQTETAKHLFQKGSEAFRNSNFSETCKLFEKAIEIEPDIPLLYEQLGAFYFLMKDIPNALKYTIKATEINPYQIRSYELLERIYDTVGQKDKVEQVNQILRSFGVMYENFLCDAGFKMLNRPDFSKNRKANYEVAKFLFQKALTVNPNNKEAQFFLNDIEYQSYLDTELEKFNGDYTRAVEYYRKQIELNPDDKIAIALLNLAEVRQLGLDI